MRKQEYFEESWPELSNKSISTNYPNLYKQERDWTCALACIRTLEGKYREPRSEEELIETYRIEKGPHYSKEVKEKGILKEYEVKYGCDEEERANKFGDILKYLEEGYGVMLESMVNYAHWTVLLGYYVLDKENAESQLIVMYDPYYNELKVMRADEFQGMWRDGGHETTGIIQDYIAIRGKER